MARCFDFALVKLVDSESRDERLNIGLAIFHADRLDIRPSRRIEKVRAMSGAIDVERVRSALMSLKRLDDTVRSTSGSLELRHRLLSKSGRLTLSQFGQFSADGIVEYEERVSSILKKLVDSEPPRVRAHKRRSRLAAQLRESLKQENILAAKNEDIASHRIVQRYEIDEGLVADFALKNGAMHVIETVDASDIERQRQMLSEIGLASLVLERARMKFGKDQTNSKLVYVASSETERLAQPALDAAENQGASLVNWMSDTDREQLLGTLTSLAEPRGPRKQFKSARFNSDQRKLQL